MTPEPTASEPRHAWSPGPPHHLGLCQGAKLDPNGFWKAKRYGAVIDHAIDGYRSAPMLVQRLVSRYGINPQLTSDMGELDRISQSAIPHHRAQDRHTMLREEQPRRAV